MRSRPADDLFERHFEEIFRFLSVQVGPEQAEDLAQEVFLIAYRAVSPPDSARP
ncbi:MAG: hypothetical protein ACRENV_08800 [Candidatus Dormibacteria bacterium]